MKSRTYGIEGGHVKTIGNVIAGIGLGGMVAWAAAILVSGVAVLAMAIHWLIQVLQ